MKTFTQFIGESQASPESEDRQTLIALLGHTAAKKIKDLFGDDWIALRFNSPRDSEGVRLIWSEIIDRQAADSSFDMDSYTGDYTCYVFNSGPRVLWLDHHENIMKDLYIISPDDLARLQNGGIEGWTIDTIFADF